MEISKGKMRTAAVSSLALFGFILLSLACASAPEPDTAIPKTTITIDDLNVWLKNQEVNLLANNELTSNQLMEVTKLCISTGELTDVVILEENEVLSYAVIGSNIKVGDVPLFFRFSYSISKNGTLHMRIMDATEQSETTPFSKTMNSSDVETYKASVIESFSSKLKKIGETVLSRSADFA